MSQAHAAYLGNVGRGSGRMQNIGFGALGTELWQTAQALAPMGACRICEPGRMAEPSMMWRHDGEICVAKLLRWCDIEMHREAPPAVEEATQVHRDLSK